MVLDRKSIADYITITSGVFGRLLISLVYFLIVANVLPVGEFGLFAAASAVGLILSRLLAFGFISPVYRAATVKPRILGVYLGGLAVLAILSVPLLAAAAMGVHAVFFAQKLTVLSFLLIIAAEVLGSRSMEFCAITLNGLSRFGHAARLVIIASALRTLAAIVFYAMALQGLDAWVWFNLAAALGGAAIGLVFFMPRARLRFDAAICMRRLKDALLTAASELAFYAQAELDKVVVLTFAGDRIAGLYAIIMRLVDLTAIPVRSFNQMLVQKLMRGGGANASPVGRMLVEVAIAGVSTAGFAAFIILLWLKPGILGGNIARVAPYLLPMLLIPMFRNLTEYHGELLYARELVFTRLALLCGLMAVKLGLMSALLLRDAELSVWAMPLTGVFAVVYAVSAVVTYGRLRGPLP